MPKAATLACGLLLLAWSFSAALPAAPVQPAAQATTATTAADAWLARTARLQFQPQAAADDPIQVDLPKKDWMVLPSSGSLVIAMASRKGDAVVLVERSALRQALEPEDITDLFAQIEVDAIKERYPKAAGFESKAAADLAAIAAGWQVADEQGAGNHRCPECLQRASVRDWGDPDLAEELEERRGAYVDLRSYGAQ